MRGPLTIANTQLEPDSWDEIEGWAGDDHAAAFAAFVASCRAVMNGRRGSRDGRPVYPGLLKVCRRARAAVPLHGEGARKFFETNFRPVRIAKLGETEGFLTGYYEPIVLGSRFPAGDFKTPLYRRPRDLVVSGKYRKAEGFPNKGRVLRRVSRHKFVSYYDRGEIEDGALDGRHLEICWLKDPIDAFFIHIQGSARVLLEDGSVLRVNYDGHNGHPYTPVGRILIERDLVPKEEMSMARIREWMEAHPEEGRALRRQNKSFIFFRVTGLSDQDEPVGAQGASLTPLRSIAVDKAIHVYGTPFFISADLPVASASPETKFQRLVIAQDTGSAIVGPARADIYFGAGDEAGRIAGRIRHPARFVMLVPREVDPVVAGARMPLPPMPPRFPPADFAENTAAQALLPVPNAVPIPRPRPKPKS
jgi:membrane-bound lytic murein transglycosylase A